jgi:hypothetical protein
LSRGQLCVDALYAFPNVAGAYMGDQWPNHLRAFRLPGSARDVNDGHVAGALFHAPSSQLM